MTDTFGKPAQPRILSRRVIDKKIQSVIKYSYASLLQIELKLHRIQSLNGSSELLTQARDDIQYIVKSLKEIKK